MLLNSMDPDGAYYKVRENYAQVIIIGPMPFSPSAYLEALNHLLDEDFEHYYNTFLDAPTEKASAQRVLQRGFVSLHFKKL